jgi:GNAT superfamily N-acetyltransferase
MYILDESQYWQALLPLSKVKANHYFALFVLEKRIKGRVFADDPEKPTAFCVVHPYGMSLLFGSTTNKKFHAFLRNYLFNEDGNRNKPEWMQAYPVTWNKKITQLIGDRLVKPGLSNTSEKQIEVHTRANFRFNEKAFTRLRKDLGKPPYPIIPANRSVFERMKGTVVPKYFWNNADDFCNHGAGFSMIINGEPACTAYSAYIFEGVLEIGIETDPKYRGKGYAMQTCAALIDYCLINNYEPVWSCRLENTGSYLLAQKLGFHPTKTLPYYLLPV